jgi:hypothetical protein
MNGFKKRKVTASGIAGYAGEVFGGIMVPVVGTTTTITAYDDTSAVAGNLLFPATATLTAGQYVTPVGGVVPITADKALGGGLLLDIGLYLTVGGTGSPSMWVLYK